jgi:hypothetical protein
MCIYKHTHIHRKLDSENTCGPKRFSLGLLESRQCSGRRAMSARRLLRAVSSGEHTPGCPDSLLKTGAQVLWAEGDSRVLVGLGGHME